MSQLYTLLSRQGRSTTVAGMLLPREEAERQLDLKACMLINLGCNIEYLEALDGGLPAFNAIALNGDLTTCWIQPSQIIQDAK